VIDASLISENAYFIKKREAATPARPSPNHPGDDSLCDICYLSGRKSCAVPAASSHQQQEALDAIRPWLPLYEGFFTYGGMSSKEIEAMAVGVREMTDDAVASASADFIKYFVDKLLELKVPVVTPAGGLACHVDAGRFLRT